MIKRSIVVFIFFILISTLTSCSGENSGRRYLSDVSPEVKNINNLIQQLSAPMTTSLPIHKTDRNAARRELKKLIKVRRALSVLADRAEDKSAPADFKLNHLDLTRLINDALFLSTDMEEEVGYLTRMGGMLEEWRTAAATLSSETASRDEDVRIFTEYKNKLSEIRVKMQELVPPADFSETHNRELALIDRKIQLGAFYLDVFQNNNDILGYSLDNIDHKVEDEIVKEEEEIDEIASFKSGLLNERLRRLRRDQLFLLKTFAARQEAGR